MTNIGIKDIYGVKVKENSLLLHPLYIENYSSEYKYLRQYIIKSKYFDRYIGLFYGDSDKEGVINGNIMNDIITGRVVVFRWRDVWRYRLNRFIERWVLGI